MLKRLGTKPLSTGAAAIYPYSDKLAAKFTAVSRFDDPYPMYRVFGKQNNKRIALPREFCPLSDTDLRNPGAEVEFTSDFTPRNDTQQRWVEGSTKFLSEGKSGISQAPTGFGKTWCAMQVIQLIGRKTLIVVTKEDLRDQWIEAAQAVLGLKSKEIGIVQGKRCEHVGTKIMIGMVQSLSSFGAYPPAAWKGIGLTIFDEVHRVASNHFSNTCWILPSKLRWGLSATPERQDGKEELIKGNIGPVRVVTSQMALVPRVYRVRTEVEFPKWMAKSLKPGRTMHASKAIAEDMRRNYFIARFVKKAYDANRHIVVFSDIKAHLDWIRIACIKAGIPGKDVAHYVGGLTKQERETAKKKRVILATYAFTAEATNIPWLDTLVFATPKSNVVQITGRILREWEGKRHPVVLDLIDPHWIFQRYGDKRLEWYTEIGAEIKGLSYG